MTFETDVLVVGSGPTGMTTALALATYGVKVHVVSKWNWLANTPRAHITNQRAAEVLRDLGIEEEVTKYAVPWELMGDTLFTTSLAGEEVARLRTWGTGPDRATNYLQASPCTLLDVPQDIVEPILLNNAAKRGTQISMNTEYVSHVQDADGVTTKLLDRLTGREYEIRSKYLVGADGAQSKIVEDLDLPFEGHLARAGTLYTLFHADLSKYVEHRPSILYWVMTPEADFGEIGMGLLRTVRPWNEWIAGWGFDMNKVEEVKEANNLHSGPVQFTAPDADVETVTRKIRALVGDPDLEIDVKWSSTWFVNQSHATNFQKGRVLCGGDAVHRHPPSGGLGSNTCISDGFNLAWKLAYVINGYAGPELLESYSQERVPVGEQIVTRANKSRHTYAPLREAFAAPEAADRIQGGLDKLADPTPEGAQARAALRDAVELRNYEFNALGVEVNHRYESNAVIADGTVETWERDRELYYQASTRPGAKIPHAWLVDKAGLRVSTMDVVGKGKLSLVTGLAGKAWADAVNALDLPFLQAVVIDSPNARDLYGDWARIREISEAGALLVRPDGFIAWRQMNDVTDQAEAIKQLTAAVNAVLSK